jgi:alkylation response protein AidB-like acyl-CoA dehydrogenase
MDFRLTAEQALLRKSVREFAEAEIRPHVRAWDEAQHFPVELVPALAGLGLMGIRIPDAYGGAGMSAIDYCICIEELARVDPSVALSVAAHNGLCVAHIALAGNEAQKQRYLVPLASGRQVGAWGLTESTSGSDAAGMHTTAVPSGDGWTLNGSKAFTTHGQVGDVMVAWPSPTAWRAPRASRRSSSRRGRRGCQLEKEDKLGMRASETSEVVFENCRVPADQLLGGEGRGFVDAMQVLDAGRIGIAALAVGWPRRMKRRSTTRASGTHSKANCRISGHSVEARR